MEESPRTKRALASLIVVICVILVGVFLFVTSGVMGLWMDPDDEVPSSLIQLQ